MPPVAASAADAVVAKVIEALDGFEISEAPDVHIEKLAEIATLVGVDVVRCGNKCRCVVRFEKPSPKLQAVEETRQ